MLKTSTQAILDFGMVPPPISIHKIDNDLFAASWACLRETLLVGQVPRYFKEAVATGAAEANKCPYCIGAHSMMFDIFKPKTNPPSHPGKASNIMDTEALSNWASSCYLPENSRPVQPFPKTFQAEIIGTAVFFHYLTRMVSIYLGDSIIPKKLEWSVPIMMPLMRLLMGLNDKRRKKPGTSRLPNIPSNKGPEWADQDNVKAAFSQFQHITENKISTILDKPMIEFINTYLSSWERLADTPGAGWVNRYIDDCPEMSLLKKQQARYMLMTIGSPYMILDDHKEFLMKKMGLSDLLAMTAWVALKAALRTGDIISSSEKKHATNT